MDSKTGSVVAAIVTIATAPAPPMAASVFIGGYLAFRLEVHHE